VRSNSVAEYMGGDLGETGGRSPKNLRWGRPMHPSPQYFGTVIGSETKHELSKKEFARVNSGCEIGFFVKKRGHLLFSRRSRQKTQNTGR